MLKVASSIEDSLNTLYKQLHQKTVETDLLKSEHERCLSNLDIYKSKINFLEAEVNILRDKLDEDIQKIESLGQEKNKLFTENDLQKNEIKSLNHIIDNLNFCLTSAQEENKVFKRQNNSLVDIVERSKVLSRYALQLHKKIAHLDKEQESVKCIIDQYEKSVNYLNIRFIKLPRNMEKIDLKIKYRYESMKELLQDFSKYKEFCSNTKILFKEKLEKNKEKNETAPEVFKIKGNPVEDLTKQIEENENKIRTLKNENHKLQQLLARFKSIKAS